MNSTRPSEGSRLLQWVFRRGRHLLVCELAHRTSEDRYTLSLVPQWARTQGAEESFESGLSAFQRHATIATSLRETGWTVVAYTDTSPFIPVGGVALDRRVA